MGRRRYLVSYDIADDKRRNGVFRLCEDSGDHVQYSVFICELNRQELVELKANLKEAILAREDQVIILDMGQTDLPIEKALETLGRAYEPPGRVLVV